jgi:hypothetical protein
LDAPEPDKAALEALSHRGRTCVIYAQPPDAAVFGWGWQSADRKSKGLFRYFYECVQDARKHGYAVDFAAVASALKSPPRKPAE